MVLKGATHVVLYDKDQYVDLVIAAAIDYFKQEPKARAFEQAPVPNSAQENSKQKNFAISPAEAMKHAHPLTIVAEVPRLIATQVARPLRLALREPQEHPETQRQLRVLVERALSHKIRAGYTHRFITLMFVTVGDRVFCRRYTYSEPSWHSAFRADPAGQIKLDKTVVNIDAHVPDDLDDILPAVDKAYADKLKRLGASFMLAGAVEPRAQASTIEITLSKSSARP